MKKLKFEELEYLQPSIHEAYLETREAFVSAFKNQEYKVAHMLYDALEILSMAESEHEYIMKHPDYNSFISLEDFINY